MKTALCGFSELGRKIVRVAKIILLAIVCSLRDYLYI